MFGFLLEGGSQGRAVNRRAVLFSAASITYVT